MAWKNIQRMFGHYLQVLFFVSYSLLSSFTFSAISVHKLVITFTMSLELLQTGPTMFVFLTYLVTFSLVNPVGIGVGMIISHTGHADGVTEAVFQGRLLVCLTNKYFFFKENPIRVTFQYVFFFDWLLCRWST